MKEKGVVILSQHNKELKVKKQRTGTNEGKVSVKDSPEGYVLGYVLFFISINNKSYYFQ